MPTLAEFDNETRIDLRPTLSTTAYRLMAMSLNYRKQTYAQVDKQGRNYLRNSINHHNT